MYTYQIDYGSGYETVYPDGYGMHTSECAASDVECVEADGCWDPGSDDHEAWFDALVEEGAAVRAAVFFGSQQVEERVFGDAVAEA